MMAEAMESTSADMVMTQADSDGNATAGVAATNNQNNKDTGTDEFGIRENLNETVFFYPEVAIDDGKASLKFTMNEALTKWNLLLFAHNKELQYVFDRRSVVTQKALMIEPHMPRYIRQGDVMVVNAKVSNLTTGDLSTETKIEILDAITGADINAQLVSNATAIKTSLNSGESKTVGWRFHVPMDFTAPLQIKMWSKGGNHMDGEQNVVPVLTNTMLVTETLPMHVSSGSTKVFDFDGMQKLTGSSTLTNHNYSLEFTVNPNGYEAIYDRINQCVLR